VELAETGLIVEVIPRNGYCQVVVRGEVDLTMSPLLAARLAVAADGGPPRLVVDLHDVGFLDCSGVNALLRAMRAAEERGGFLYVGAVHPRVRRVLELAGVEKALSDTEAVRAAWPAAPFLLDG
jgi:anti-anti-sigma factor